MNRPNTPRTSSHVLPFHFFPQLSPSQRPLPTTTTSALEAFPFNSFDEVISYSEDLGVASDASVNLLLAFFMLISNLRRNAREKTQPRLIDHLSPVPTPPQDALSCDFEAGWCPGWNQSRSDHLDWSLNKGPTNTENTGPDVDHTRNDAEGQYVYMEASGGNFGNTAAFRSPLVSMKGHSNHCLRFWYLMHGEGLGTLSVFWSPTKKAGSSGPKIFLVASKSGQQSDNGSDWLQLAATINSPSNYGYTSDVYFEFQATRGFSSSSDIAVDDISLSPGPCPDAPPTEQAISTLASVAATTAPIPPTTFRRKPPTSPPNSRYPERCGGRRYDRERFACCDGRLSAINSTVEQECCGDRLYDVGRSSCCGGKAFTQGLIGCCDGRPYNRLIRSCCSGKTYVPAMSDCVEGVILKRQQ